MDGVVILLEIFILREGLILVIENIVVVFEKHYSGSILSRFYDPEYGDAIRKQIDDIGGLGRKQRRVVKEEDVQEIKYRPHGSVQIYMLYFNTGVDLAP